MGAGCGEGGDGSAGGPLGADEWRDRADQFCSDGIQEASALPLPGSVAELADDAEARAEIDSTVRDGILTLGQPDGISSDDVSAYVDDLGSDIDVLGRIADAAAAGDDVTELNGQLDESAGQLADGLGLDACVGLANAIARTP